MISISAALCGLIFLIKKERIGEILQLGWPLIALCLCYTASLAVHPSFTALKHSLAVLSITLFFFFYVQNGSTIRRNPIFLIGATMASIAFLMPSLLGLNMKNFDGGMAFYGMCVIVFLFMGNRPPNSSIAITIAIAFGAATSIYGYLIDFRMLITYGMLLALCYLLLSWRPGLTRLYRSSFLLLITTIGATMFFYMNIENSLYLTEINDFFIRTTDRPALSGRQILWPAIASAISENPWIGLGAGTLPSDIIDTDFSAHNYYLQVTLQVGLIGLTLALTCVYRIWRELFKAKRKASSLIFAIATLIIFVLHNASEVIMFQNALRVAIPAWIIFFIATSSSIREATQSDESI
ncbi:O-antigen ligase family protein [Stenotrophomonas sp. Iso1]|uniref:O-antigen ligase family protein n=1 Tax=Stenotrophomonas sp. Iso1 TaxID=2977283 RepID=UPI0022B7C80A|nr:O-antigen ligase family protein [Stenotrophomonas sp. Iso1]